MDLRAILEAPCILSANPHFYDYIHFVKFETGSAVEMVAGSGQVLRRRIVGKMRVLSVTASAAEVLFFDLLDTDPYERSPETRAVEDRTIRIEVEAGPFAMPCEVVWNVTEEEAPWLVFQHRLVFSEDPLALGEPEIPKEILEFPEMKAFFAKSLEMKESQRRYWLPSDGVELPKREMERLGLPQSAFAQALAG
jgi:hypothetical protein